MRTVALALIFAATGCNWFFGLEKTNLLPGDAIDAPPGHGVITYWLAESHPSDQISFPPLPDTMVQYGALDGELIDAANGPSGFTINEPEGTPYRLVYTLPGDPMPHEIQWSITSGIHLTVPRIGRLERKAPVPGSGYSWTLPACSSPPCLQGTPNLYAFSTGVWMQGSATYNSSNEGVSFSASSLTSLEGGPDQLDFAGNGDTLMLLEYQLGGFPPDQEWSAAGYIIPQNIGPLSTGTMVVSQPPFLELRPGGAISVFYEPQALPPNIALNAALGGLYNSSTLLNQATGGILPNTTMPAMTEPGNGDLPRSVFIPIDNAIDPIGSGCRPLLWPWNPTQLSPDQIRPIAVTYRQYTTRTLNGVKLASGFEEIAAAIRAPQPCTSGGGGQTDPIKFDVGIAQIPKLAGTMLSADGTPVTMPAHSFVTLEFDLADGRERNTSDCIATLYRIDTTKGLVAVRSVQVIAAQKNQAHFPTDDFTTGPQHVFSIECRSGYPNAASGDYTVFSGFPQQTSQAFPGSFTVAFQ